MAGTPALLSRLLDVATNLTSASLGPILIKEAADRHRRGMLWIFLLPGGDRGRNIRPDLNLASPVSSATFNAKAEVQRFLRAAIFAGRTP